MKKLSLLFITIFYCFSAIAQTDTLPKFSAKKLKSGEIFISWANTFKNVSQINIQRSKDSLRNFSTIHSVPTPNLRSYFFSDKTAKNDSGYYRIFILFEGSNYVFTPSKKLTIDTSLSSTMMKESNHRPDYIPANKGRDEKTQIPPAQVWVPSVYVFTGNDGNPVINLPAASSKKYSIRFMKEDGSHLFTIPSIRESFLTLDKVNFMKSGWYQFELMENGILKEKNKFLITRDF